MGVEGDCRADERVEFAEARGEDPFVEESHRFGVSAGLVHGAQLVNEQPSEVDGLVRFGELSEDRLVAGFEAVAPSSEGEPLPDRSCTSGALNPKVKPSTLATTICKSGYTPRIRPPSSVTAVDNEG